MRFDFLLLFSAIFVSSLHAAPVGLDNFAGELTSLNYYPHFGRAEVDAHLATALANGASVDTGAISRTNSTQFYGEMIFGLGGGLRLGIAETLLWDQTIDSTSAAGIETTNVSQGLSNPTLLVAWRYLEAPRSRLSGDLTFSVAPSFGPKIAGDGTNGKTGNNLSGGWNATIEAEFFWRLKRNQIELAPSITKNYAIQSEGTAGVTSTTDAYWSPELSFIDRYHLNRHHFLQASALYYLTQNRSAMTDGGVSTSTHVSASVSPSLLYGYEPERETLCELSVSWRKYNSEATSAGVTATSAVQTLVLTLAFLHQF